MLLAHSGRRPAYAALLLILSLPALSLAIGLAINYSYIHDARTQLRNAADAAALAAAYELVDDRVLADRGENDVVDLLKLLEEAGFEACSYIAKNPVPLGPGNVELKPNIDNCPGGDVVFGFLKHRKDKDFFVADLKNPEAKLARINAVQVKAERCRERNNPVGLLPVPFQLASSANVCMMATAFLDGHIQGFRPCKSVAVPLAPIGILTGSGPHTWESKLKEKTDAFRYDPTLKKILPLGGDRIYEVEVKLGAGEVGPDCNACLLQLGATSLQELAAQLLTGITEEALSFQGLEYLRGEIVLPLDGAGLPLPGTLIGPSPDAGGETEISLELKKLLASGEGRIWPLFSLSKGPGEAQIVLRGFVAARVAQVRPASGKISLHFVLQPCRLSTGTAITFVPDASAPSPLGWNDYICKVRLTE